MKSIGLTIVGAVLLGGLFTASGCTNPEVPAGHEGYIFYKPLIFSKMEYRDSLTGPASTGISWRLYTTNVDMRAKSYNEHFDLLTKDNLKIQFEVNTRIKPKNGEVKSIVEQWGASSWYDWNVKEPLRTIVRETVTEFRAGEIQLDTPAAKAEIERKLNEKYKASPFSILSVDIGQIQFPDEVAAAIQAKIAATETLKKQEYVLEKTEKEAAIAVLEALKVAKQQRIISETLDPLYVQRRAVQVYKRLGESKNKAIIVLPNSPEGTGLPLVMSKGKHKKLSQADKALLKDMENKYMALAKAGTGVHAVDPSAGDKGSESLKKDAADKDAADKDAADPGATDEKDAPKPDAPVAPAAP